MDLTAHFQGVDPEQLKDFLTRYGLYEKRDKLERYKRLNRFALPGQIVFAGSSLMEQFPVNELLAGEPLPLAVYNRGIGGFTCREFLDALDVCVCDLRPSNILLNIGTNDLNSPESDNASLTAQYGRILDEIAEKLPEAKTVMLAYYPVCPDACAAGSFMASILSVRSNERIASANSALSALAKSRGIPFLDLNSAVEDEKGALRLDYTVDGMHMYADGYRAVLMKLLPILRNMTGTQKPF